MWADSLKTEEVAGTLDAVDQLGGVGWAAPLLSQAASILDRLRVGLTDKDAYLANPITPAEMSFLFEIRFARALANARLTATYEHPAGVGNSTVDFRVDLDPPWLIELVSLHESDAFKAATWTDGVFHGYLLRTDADDPKQSEEGEALKAQERIGAKVFDRKHGPIKFPEPDGSVHMVMVDARGFMGNGHGNAADWRQIIHRPVGVEHHLVKHWTNPQTGMTAPIRGLFEQACPLPAAQVARDRLHIIGFVCESSFTKFEIHQQSFYLCNPARFASEEAARVTMSQWPLRRQALEKDVPIIVHRGEKIICPDGHLCGSVTEDVHDGDHIKGNFLRIEGAADAISDEHVGHICLVPGCGKAITEVRDGCFKIHTARGWVGEFP